jgi:hypothetical protein
MSKLKEATINYNESLTLSQTKASNSTQSSIILGSDFHTTTHYDKKESVTNLGLDVFLGNLQQLIRQEENNLVLDLRNSGWISAKSILIVLVDIFCWIKTDKNRRLLLQLPSSKALRSSKEQQINFLYKNGFIHALLEIDDQIDIRLDRARLANTNALINLMRSISTPTKYKSITCIKAQIFNVDTDEIYKKIDDLIIEAKESGLKQYFISNINTTRPNFLLEELRQSLIELVTNVKQHAYRGPMKGMPKYVGIFCRIRFGYNDSQDDHTRQNIIEWQTNERKRSKELARSEQLDSTGYLELFVSDAGIGLASHINKKNPIRAFFEDLVQGKNVSRLDTAARKKRALSEISGLSHLVMMLSERNSFIRVLQKKEWFGSILPLTKGHCIQRGRAIPTPANFHTPLKSHVFGTHYTIRISCGMPTRLPSGWNAYIKGQLDSRIIDEAYQAIDAPPKRWTAAKISIFDEGHPNASAKELTVSINDASPTDDKLFIWRPISTLLRNEIIKNVTSLLSQNRGTHFVIADLDLSASFMAEKVIRMSKDIRASALANDIKSISILTDSLCYISPYENRHQTPFSPNNSGVGIGHIIYALKRLDSTLFWESVAKHNEQHNLIIDGQIEWKAERKSGQRTFLTSYMNFSNTYNIKLCRWIYKRNLGRFMAYISSNENAKSIDNLVDNLLGSFTHQQNSNFLNSTTTRENVLLGSVVVSGDTARAIEEEWGHTSQYSPTCIAHFFKHPKLVIDDSDNNHFYWLLQWLHTPILSEEIFKRIEDSPLVSEQGNKFWRVLRSKNVVQYLYGCSPAISCGYSIDDVYSEWQENELIKFGHWRDWQHHDGLTIDIMSYLKKGSISKNNMAWTYLLSHCERLKPDFRNALFSRCDYMVCTATHGSSYIVEKIVELHPLLSGKIILIPYVQRRRAAMPLRLCPQGLKTLEKKLSDLGDTNKRVLLFNVTLGSTRTFNELVDIIKQCGANDVDSISLLDRSRVPARIHEGNVNTVCFKHSRLWRFDVDHLAPASDGHALSPGCPMCSALKKVQEYQHHFISPIIKERLSKWETPFTITKMDEVSKISGVYNDDLPIEFHKSIKYGLNNSRSSSCDTVQIQVHPAQEYF